MKYTLRITEEQRALLMCALKSHKDLHPEQFDPISIPSCNRDGFIYDHVVTSPATDFEHRLQALPRHSFNQTHGRDDIR